MPPRSVSTFVSFAVVASAFATAAGIARRLDERDRRRPLEHDEERVGACLLGGAPRERVLHDAEARAVRDQLVAQRLELLVREAAVVGDDERVGRAQLRASSSTIRSLSVFSTSCPPE